MIEIGYRSMAETVADFDRERRLITDLMIGTGCDRVGGSGNSNEGSCGPQSPFD